MIKTINLNNNKNNSNISYLTFENIIVLSKYYRSTTFSSIYYGTYRIPLNGEFLSTYAHRVLNTSTNSNRTSPEVDTDNPTSTTVYPIPPWSERGRKGGREGGREGVRDREVERENEGEREGGEVSEGGNYGGMWRQREGERKRKKQQSSR